MIDPGALQHLHFLRPHWLWALVLLPVLAWAWGRQRHRRNAWRGVVDPHLLPHLLEPGSPRHGRVARWLVLPAVALAILALAGPSWQRTAQPLWQVRAPLVLALDLSGATSAGDLPPSRLAQARAGLATLLRERKGGQVGLLVFADDAYVVAPLTDDAANVALFLDALSPDIMPMDGTGDAPAASRAGPAIGRAADLLRQAGFDRGDILVLSDHADAAARAAAGTAAAAGFRVSAIGLGTAVGAPWRDASGRIVHASLDAASLRALARAGGGSYASLADAADDAGTLGVPEPGAAGAIAKRGESASQWRDQGYWLLLPLLLLAPFAFRRNGMFFAVLALCLCLPWRPAQAAAVDWWLRADQQAHARMQDGANAYHGDDYAAAERAWNGLPGADAAYNRGNALARQGRYPDALAAYDEALRLQPGMADALANRKAVEAAMKRKPPAGARPGQQDGKPGKDKQGENKRDEGRQDDADAAQRERMRRAARQAHPGQTHPGQDQPSAQARTPETAAQRERRLANQAWLRRVPDDPGGLLRERFRLEHERREQEGE